MLAYAANRPVFVDRKPYPNAMLMIIAVHVALIAAVMSAKIEFDRLRPPPPLVVETIPLPPPPAPNPMPHSTKPQTSTTTYVSNPAGPKPFSSGPSAPTGPTTTADPGPIGPVPTPMPQPGPLAEPHPGNSAAQLLTATSELKPPYPPSKLLNEEEAVLRLRLTIDEHGRVVSVDPVGRTDPVFLEAARNHLMAHWRYKPAIEGGHAVASSTVITLRFQLDG